MNRSGSNLRSSANLKCPFFVRARSPVSTLQLSNIQRKQCTYLFMLFVTERISRSSIVRKRRRRRWSRSSAEYLSSTWYPPIWMLQTDCRRAHYISRVLLRFFFVARLVLLFLHLLTTTAAVFVIRTITANSNNLYSLHG